MRIRLLGALSIELEGRAVALPSRKAAGLLAVLAARPGAELTRERAAALLWSRAAEAQARGSLRQALAQLRKALDDPDGSIIEARGESLRLVPAGADVDAAVVEAAVAADTPDGVMEAAARYAGKLLDTFTLNEEPFEEWRRTEAARLHDLVILALERLLARRIDAGDAEAALAVGERLLGLEPTSEEAHLALMRLHLDRGAFSAAVRQYERCRAALSQELGVAPSAEIEKLRRQALTRPPPTSDLSEGALPSIAVLPFANLSDDPAQAYFAQGFAEDVIRELSRFRALRVISRHSSFVFAEARMPAREIGERLGARYLLAGSIRKAARSLRIGTELVDAASGRQVWAHRYDIAPGGLLQAQDDIARDVAVALAARIDEEILHRARRKPVQDLQAYDCWLRGIACLRRGTLESHEEARMLFRRALETDPHFARAYAGLSLTHFNDWSCNAWSRWDENERHAFDYAHKGVELDDTDHVTHFILGRILLYRRAFEPAEQHLHRAEALNSSDADILAHLALAYAYLDEAERGIEAARTAMRLNPFHDDWYFAFCAAPYMAAGRLEEGIALAVRAPDAATDVRAYLAAAFAYLGQTEEARRQLAGFLHLFRRNITFGREPGPDEPVRWLLRVNPFKRAESVAYLVDGLRMAGLPVPDGIASTAPIPAAAAIDRADPSR